MRKIRPRLNVKVQFAIIYETKKFIRFFVSSKDQVLDITRSNVVYEISCPECNQKFIGKRERCLEATLTVILFHTY